ncbi:hypothetical protein [Paraburkholderia hospita]|uniref:hypothetical protein n=1 Tax=Paraburkholderia hospita TaxID=169430 RepID=UPI000B3491C1|nr:hypothetical protein [Paraburkholderia hospita]OUL68701.1 hypothetical protein CA603_51590 [Paraburkholderia hospita]
MGQENFVEWGNQQFSDRVRNAARKGLVRETAPLLDALQEIHAASRGLEQICKIAQANRVQEESWRDKDDDDESMQPPMSINTVEALLALGEVVSRSMVGNVERLSNWLEKYGVKEPDPVADLAIAAQAAVAQARRSRIAMPDTESETA